MFKPVKEVADKGGEVWIKAEVRIGAELAKMPKATGGQPYQKSTGPKADPVAPTLEEVGVTKKRAVDRHCEGFRRLLESKGAASGLRPLAGYLKICSG